MPIVGQVSAALPHRLTVEQVEAMLAAGILSKADRCELIRGELIDKMVLGDPHMAVVRRLNRWLQFVAGERYLVGVQDAIKLLDSRPEPDVTLLTYRADFYSAQTPVAADVCLLIEVADSTLAIDRKVKLPLYAENAIREYWIVNLVEQCVEVHRDPLSRGEYAQRFVVRRGESVSSLAMPESAMTIDDVLGPLAAS